jgi:hypothetical protein
MAGRAPQGARTIREFDRGLIKGAWLRVLASRPSHAAKRIRCGKCLLHQIISTPMGATRLHALLDRKATLRKLRRISIGGLAQPYLTHNWATCESCSRPSLTKAKLASRPSRIRKTRPAGRWNRAPIRTYTHISRYTRRTAPRAKAAQRLRCAYPDCPWTWMRRVRSEAATRVRPRTWKPSVC